MPVFIRQTAPILQMKLHGRFLPISLGLLPTRYRVAFPSRSCNLTPNLLPCFMVGSVYPVHALYGPAPDEFDLFVKPHQSCIVIFVFCSSYDMYQVCGMFICLIELFFPRVSVSLFAFHVCTF